MSKRACNLSVWHYLNSQLSFLFFSPPHPELLPSFLSIQSLMMKFMVGILNSIHFKK